MITIHVPHPCKRCKVEIPTWEFPDKIVANVSLRQVFPLVDPPGHAQYKCKACGHAGRGELVIKNLDRDNVLMDVKEIVYGRT